MEFCEVEIKVDGKVIGTISNLEISKLVEEELKIGVEVFALADLQQQMWEEIEYNTLLGTSVPEFHDCDNVKEIMTFIDKWVHNAFISCLTNDYYKRYKINKIDGKLH